MSAKPIVMISSYPPRLCGVAAFCEEAREFIRKANPHRQVLVISHTDARGDDIFPLIDLKRSDWWQVIAGEVEKLDPYVVHIEHEYGLYEPDELKTDDGGEGFLDLLEAIGNFPIVVETHAIPGRLTDSQADFVYKVCQKSHLVLFKCHYQKLGLDCLFPDQGWYKPRNIMVVPHGARPYRRWGPHEILKLRREFGLDETGLANNIVGMMDEAQAGRHWDILLSMWEEIHHEIKRFTDCEWNLLAAAPCEPPHKDDPEEWKSNLQVLLDKGIAHYHTITPGSDDFYKLIAVCDFIVLPSTAETQFGILAQVISLNKPFIITAPIEGLTAQTLESEGGLFFTNKEMLKRKVIRLACDQGLRFRLCQNLKRYLDQVASWEVVAWHYNEAYKLARKACHSGSPVVLAGV